MLKVVCIRRFWSSIFACILLDFFYSKLTHFYSFPKCTHKPLFILIICFKSNKLHTKPPHNNFYANNLHKKPSHTKNSHKNHHTNPSPPIIKSINIFVVINKHKAKIYNHCTYTQIIIKNIFPFFSSESIRMSENRINFDDKKTKKVTSTITKTKRYLI